MSYPPQAPAQYGQPVQPSRKRRGLAIFAVVTVALFACIIGAVVISQSGNKGSSTSGQAAATGGTTTTKPAGHAAAATTKPAAGPVSVEEQNAIRSAQEYLATGAFSRKGLIRQLSSDAGDGYSVKAATAAVDSLHIDFNEQAAKSAKAYLQTSSFSRKGLIEQLESDAGEGFTHAQAVYGVTKAGL